MSPVVFVNRSIISSLLESTGPRSVPVSAHPAQSCARTLSEQQAHTFAERYGRLIYSHIFIHSSSSSSTLVLLNTFQLISTHYNTFQHFSNISTLFKLFELIPTFSLSVAPIDSLGGNSKTIMVATIRTDAEYYQQTAVTLMYAARAKKVSTTPQHRGGQHSLDTDLGP